MLNKWYAPTTPEHMKPHPWLSQGAIDYLESILTPDSEVLEHGSGGSTLWFSERVKHVTAIESDFKWFKEVGKRTNGNVSLFFGTNVLTVLPVDVLFIDGEPVGNRAKWLAYAKQLVKPGGWIVLDNSNRPEYENERQGLFSFCKLIKTADSNKPGFLYLKTEFYKVNE